MTRSFLVAEAKSKNEMLLRGALWVVNNYKSETLTERQTPGKKLFKGERYHSRDSRKNSYNQILLIPEFPGSRGRKVKELSALEG